MSDNEDASDSENNEDWNKAFDADVYQACTFINETDQKYDNSFPVKVVYNDDVETDVAPSPGEKPVTRMALNVNKAGMEGLDKEKINKIIHDASKGSKFYENEKKKEKKMLENIEAMKVDLKKYTTSDHKRALVESNKIIGELSRGIDLSRTLVHIDMDAFYAAVEMRDDPTLKNVPMAVGGTGMLSTSNYAARKFGVRAAMPGFIGLKLCPQLKIVSLHFDKYKQVSSQVRDVFGEYDPNFLPMSLDEAYLDLTDYVIENGSKYETSDQNKSIIENIVDEIRTKIFEMTQLTASAGIGPNMMLSKICSDLNKPNGQYYLKPDFELIKTFMKELPIRKVFGVGRVTEQMLNAVGVNTCSDLIERRALLYLMFSESTFRYFMNIAFGKSTNQIVHADRKSMSAERTFSDVSGTEALLNICHDLCKSLEVDLAKEKLKGYNVTLKYKLSSFVTKTRSKTVQYPVSKVDELYRISKELLLKEIHCFGAKKFELRLMGVRVSSFKLKTKREQHTLDSLFSSSWKTQERKHDKSFLSSSGTTKLEEISVTPDSVQCPICERYLADDGVSLNLHIDECLIEQNSKPSEAQSECGSVTGSTFEKNDRFVSCPVCNQPLQNDEMSLNSHIDNCLTRQDSMNCEGKLESEIIRNDSVSNGNVLENLADGIEEYNGSRSTNRLDKENCVDMTDRIACPICGRLQPNDEPSLNSHVENCLTKQTIRKLVSEQEVELSHRLVDLRTKTKSNVTVSTKNENNRQSFKRKSGESSYTNKRVTLHNFWEKK